MKKIIYMVLLLVTASCSEWLDAQSDNTSVNDKKFFEDENSFYNALIDIYTQLRAPELYGDNLSVGMLEFMGQNFVPADAVTREYSNFDYNAIENRGTLSSVWKEMYHAISSTNKLIKEIENTDVVFYNRGQKEIITGEAYALRGALHFELLRLFHPSYKENPSYAALPYMTEFGTSVGSPLSTTELIARIMKDLEHAAELLKPVDPILSGISLLPITPGEVDSRLRTFEMNYYAVTAMIARVALYEGNYTKAFEYADETFNHIRNVETRSQVFYYFTPGKYGPDFSFSREHIFGIASPPDGLTEVAETMFTEKKIKVRAGLRQIFPTATDIRYRAWFNAEGNNEYVMSGKFSKESLLIDYNKTTSGETASLPVRIPFIKLGEVALIAAESLNETDKADQAAQWIIELQTTKGTTYLADLQKKGKLDKETIREAIADEYAREFWGEGQLFYYHKRLDHEQISAYDGSVIEMDSKKYTPPVPDNAL